MPRQNRYHPYAQRHHQIQAGVSSGPPLPSPRYPHAPTLALPRALALPTISEQPSTQSSPHQFSYPSSVRRSGDGKGLPRRAPLQGAERIFHLQMAAAAAVGFSVLSEEERREQTQRTFAGNYRGVGIWAENTRNGLGEEMTCPLQLQLQGGLPHRSTTPLSQNSDTSSASLVDENACAGGMSESDEDAEGEDEEEYRLCLVRMENRDAVLGFLDGGKDD